jgi:hypothetical protein
MASQVDAPAQRLADRLPGWHGAQVKHRQGNGQAACHARKTARTGTRKQPPAAYREAWLAFIRVCRAAGVDPDWTRDLPLRLHRHALVDVGAELDVPLFRGGSARAASPL